MFKNYLKIALRNLTKNKGFTFINVFGITVGITCFILILLFIQHEFSYDKFHDNAENLYRVNLRYNIGVNKFDEALGPVPLAEALVEDFPEVLHSTRLYHTNYRGWIRYVKINNKQYREENFLYADSTVFDVFSIQLIKGNPATALLKPNSVIIKSEIAEKYFGGENPIGKMIETEDGVLYKVTGITEGLPANSHFNFDLLASFSSLPKSRDPEWYDTAVYTYVVLRDGYPWQKFDKKLPDFSHKYVEPVIQGVMGIPYKEFIAGGNYFGFFAEPLLDAHLYSDIETIFQTKGDINTVTIFGTIGFLLLLIASINFVNLSTSRSMQRANEIGIRKVVGSNKKQLISQFLIESIIITGLAVLFSLLIIMLILPEFNSFVNREIEFLFFNKWYYLPLSFLFVIIVGCAAGLYPAMILSQLKPLAILKGKSNSDTKNNKFRNALVIFQFVTTIVLFIGTLVIYHQLEYMKNKKLGYDKEQVVVINNSHKIGKNQKTFKERIVQNNNIFSASYSDCLPQILLETKIFEKEGNITNENHTLVTMMADWDITETYGFKIKEGRYFRDNFTSDSSAIVLNEAAIKALEVEDFENERLFLNGKTKIPLNIIGVLKDFHLESLHQRIRPFAALLQKERPGVYLSIRLNRGNIQETLHFIEKTWTDFVPGQPFEYIFYDDKFTEIYKAEIQAGKIFFLFAIITILIACLGLIGLVSHSASRRTKEIGIRKILGSKVSNIIMLLVKDFLKWILVANLIAWPIANYVMRNWLENFAFRIDISLWFFILATAAALLISMTSVSYQSVKAAYANPIDALRDE